MNLLHPGSKVEALANGASLASASRDEARTGGISTTDLPSIKWSYQNLQVTPDPRSQVVDALKMAVTSGS